MALNTHLCADSSYFISSLPTLNSTPPTRYLHVDVCLLASQQVRMRQEAQAKMKLEVDPI